MKQKFFLCVLLVTLCAGTLFPAYATAQNTQPTMRPQTEAEILNHQAKIDRMERELGPRITWSLEEKARMFDGYGLPAEGEITEEEAIRLAKEALQKEYGVSDEVLATLTGYSYFLVDDPENRFYAVSFFVDPIGRGDIPYTVEVASDGTILFISKTSNG